jgi:hypothetical protein
MPVRGGRTAIEAGAASTHRGLPGMARPTSAPAGAVRIGSANSIPHNHSPWQRECSMTATPRPSAAPIPAPIRALRPRVRPFFTSSRVIAVRWIRTRSFSDCRRTVIVSRSSSTSVPRTDGPPPGAADGCPATTPGACVVVTLTLAPGRATTRSEARDTPTPASDARATMRTRSTRPFCIRKHMQVSSQEWSSRSQPRSGWLRKHPCAFCPAIGVSDR